MPAQNLASKTALGGRIGLLSAALTVWAAAGLAQDVAGCIGLTESYERLACFDKAASALGPEKAALVPAVLSTTEDGEPAKVLDAPGVKDKGEGYVSEGVSALDDSKRVVVSTRSTKSIPGKYGSMIYGEFNLRCEENTTVAYFSVGDYFLSDIQGYGVIDYRVDDRKAGTIGGAESTDNSALGLWRGRDSIGFIESLMGGETLFVRITPFNESAIEMYFPITGLDVAVKPLREACGW